MQLGLRENKNQAIAFTNAVIYVSWDQVIEHGTLVVRDQLVSQVGANLAPPKDAYAVDLQGKVILPGFIDVYSDYGMPEVPKRERSRTPVYETERQGGNSWNGSIHAERSARDLFKPMGKQADDLLANGFTAVHTNSMDGVFRGQGVVVDLAQGLPAESILGPGFHGLSFDKGTSKQLYPSSLMGSIALMRQTFADAQWYASVRKSANAGEYNAALEQLADYKGGYLFESADELSLLRCAAIAKEFGLNAIYVGSNNEYQRLEAIAKLKRPVILPLVFPETPKVATAAESMDVSLASLRHWELAPGNAASLAGAGVPFAFTTYKLKKSSDFWAGLHTSIKAGLAPEQALKALTAVPAQLLNQEGQLGSLSVGKRANFSVWVESPLDDEKATWLATWVNGKSIKAARDLSFVDWRGTHQISVRDRAFVLELSGSPTGLSGKLKLDDLEESIKQVTVDDRELTFTIPMDRFAFEGVYRFRLLAHTDGTRSGEMINSFGVTQTFDLKSGPMVEASDEETDEEKEPAPTESLAKLTYPNMGYGRAMPPVAETVLLRNAVVWTSAEQGRLDGADVLVSAGVIQAVGVGLDAPAGATVVDCTGKHITAGIIDEHSHIAISGGVNEFSHAVTAEVRIGDVVNSDDINIYRALAGGVTTVQLLHGSANPIGGQAQVIKLRWGSLPEDMKFKDAPASIKFALGENVKQSNAGDEFVVRYPQSRMGVETIIRDKFQAAKEYGEKWDAYYSLKPNRRQGMLPPRRDLQLEALREILDAKRFVHCHSYVQSEILMLMRLAESFGFKIQTFTHILEGYKVALEMAAHGAGGSSFSDWWAYKFEVYDAIPTNPCLMTRAGVVSSVNSDSPELMRRLNQEAGKSVLYCGMDEEEALKLVTINPAIQLKIDHKVGSIESGKDADLVVWNGHPLSIHSSAERTMVDGRTYFSLEDDGKLRLEVEEERAKLIQKALKSPGNGSGKSKKHKGSEIWDCEDTVDFWGVNHD